MGSKPKVKTYDPSKYEAKIQTMKNELYDEITDEALRTQEGAQKASKEGIGDLYASIGLLSNYLGERAGNERVQAQISRAGRDGLLSLYGDARKQSAKIVDNFMGNYRTPSGGNRG